MKNLKLGKRVLAAILSAATVVTGISGGTACFCSIR